MKYGFRIRHEFVVKMYKEWLHMYERGYKVSFIASQYKNSRGGHYNENYVRRKIWETANKLYKRPVKTPSKRVRARLVEL